MRIGLFTEQDSGAVGSLAATGDALAAYLPDGAFIGRYSAPSNFRSLLCVRELMKRAEADRIDVVHVAATGPLALVALSVASRLGLATIGSFQPPSISSPGMVASYLRALVGRSRRLLVTSMAARSAFLRAGIGASKIIVWRPGVDAAAFAPSRRSAVLRERWGVSDARPAVIYAGGLSDDRGVRRLLAMEMALHRTRPLHQLIVAGDGASRNEVQARCPNAIFMGTVPRDDMPEVLASADLFVYPSEAISTNLAVLEAQACGLPVVVMERGSARERTADSTAVVCRSHADFIVETAALVRTEQRRQALGLAAREYACDQAWDLGLTSVYAEYRAAAEISRVRRDLQPAFIPQSRRF